MFKSSKIYVSSYESYAIITIPIIYYDYHVLIEIRQYRFTLPFNHKSKTVSATNLSYNAFKNSNVNHCIIFVRL